jgi:hypothetical protein
MASRRDRIVGGVVAALMIVAVAACGSGTTPAGFGATPIPGTPTAAHSPNASGAAPSTPPAAPIKVGDRVTILNRQREAEEYFTVKQVDLDYQGGDYYGMHPDAGVDWVVALVEIEGINPTGTSYNKTYLTVRDEHGATYSSILNWKYPALGASLDLKPGQRVEGWALFEVPDTAKALTLIYDWEHIWERYHAGQPVEVRLK